MSLRLRLFLGLSGLVAALVAAQLWWVRSLARDLTYEVGHVAFEVGHSVAAVISHEPDCPQGAECDVRIEAHEPPHTVVFHRRPDGAAPPDAATDSASASAFQWVTVNADEARTAKARFKVVRRQLAGEQHEIHLRLHPKTGGIGERDETAAAFVSVSSDDDVFERRIRIPEEGVHARFEDYERRLLLGAAGLLGGGLLLAGVVAQRVSAPLRRLTEAAREVGHGALGARVTAAGSGEVGQAIHAFNRMSSELAALDERARQLEARRHLGEIGEIARGLAHTLRNPLNALGLSVEELASRSSGGDELAAAARRQIRRIDASIRSFLALASQGGGAAEDVASAELAQDVALEALQDARGRVRLAVDADPATPAIAAVEPELRAVLQALLVNAVEASPEGGTVRIRVAPAAGAQRVRVEIEDEGPGLPPEVRGRLFTPHLTTKANGSGMGLFLAHRIASTRYGGTLELLDRDGGGVRAVLELGPRREEDGRDG
jgi:signal transduction histidine kinase